MTEPTAPRRLPATTPATPAGSVRTASVRTASVRTASVWTVSPPSVPEDELAVTRGWLDAEERARAASFARPALARDYEVAHTFLRARLAATLGLHPAGVDIRREPCARCGGPHGRPVTDGVWFSLSRADGLVAVALAATPVGVDVERRRLSFTDVARSLHPREQAEIAGCSSAEEGSVRFARAWTRTEALLKGRGLGLVREPSVDYVGTGPAPVRRISGWTVQDVTVPAGFAGAVAFRAVRRRPAPGKW